MNSLVTLIDEIEKFSNLHKQIQRFKFEFEEQLPNFATSGDSFPILFVTPIYLTQNGALNIHTLRVYVLNRLDRDRSNVLDSTNDTSLIITDLAKWWREGNLKTDILLVNEPFATPVNNSQLDYLQGYYADFEFEVPTYSRCDIPLK